MFSDATRSSTFLSLRNRQEWHLLVRAVYGGGRGVRIKKMRKGRKNTNGVGEGFVFSTYQIDLF